MSVFISYSRKDKTLADEVQQYLIDEGFPHWRDTQLKIGFPWRPAIDNAINFCPVMVVIVTAASMNSSYVTYEWSYAMGLGKMVIPLVFEPKDIHPKIQEIEFLNFQNGNREWDELKSAIKNGIQQIEPDEVKQASQSLTQPREAEWSTAVQILLHHPHPTAIKALLEATKSGNILVSALASIAYAEKTEYRDDQVVRYLKQNFLNLEKRSNMLTPAFSAVTALATIQTDECIEFIGDLLLNPSTHQQIIDQIVRSICTRPINPIFKLMMRSFLNSNMYKDRHPTVNVMQSLATLHDDEDIELFKKYANLPNQEGNFFIMTVAVNAIYEISSDKSISTFLEMLSEDAQKGYRHTTNHVIQILVEKGKMKEIIDIVNAKTTSNDMRAYIEQQVERIKRGI